MNVLLDFLKFQRPYYDDIVELLTEQYLKAFEIGPDDKTHMRPSTEELVSWLKGNPYLTFVIPEDGIGCPPKFEEVNDQFDQAQVFSSKILCDQAEYAVELLRAGDIIATGVQAHKSERAAIPLGTWFLSCTIDCRAETVTFSDGVKYFSLSLSKNEMPHSVSAAAGVLPAPIELQVQKKRGATKITAPFVNEYFNRQELVEQLSPTLEVARELFNWGLKNGYVITDKKSGKRQKPTPDAIQRAIKEALRGRLAKSP